MIKLLKKIIKKLFLPKTNIKDNDFYSFETHEEKIVNKYGFINENYFSDYLPEDLYYELKYYLKNLKKFSKRELLNEFQRYDPIVKTVNQKTLEGEADTILSGYCLDPREEVIDKLHSYLRKNFRKELKSPITFVNSKAWTTPNNTKLIAANSMHKDGFDPGHLKFLIYINGLSEEQGKIIIDKELITNKKPGFILLFKNSDVMHAAVPGKSGKRLVVEFTIMRTFVDRPQFNRSHFVGKHLSSPLLPYYKGNEESNTLLNRNYLDMFN